MNHSLVAADRATHIKIVLIALAAGTAVMIAAIQAHPIEPETQIVRIQIDPPFGKAGNPQAVTVRRTQARNSI